MGKILEEVYDFCDKNDITREEMENAYIDSKRRRKKSGITNKHHYQIDCFNQVIDWILQELNAASVRLVLNCLFVLLLLVQETSS
jgi:hypothetical protein